MTQKLEVGKTYTSKNRMGWFCIAVDGGIAHMRRAYVSRSVAHIWKLDGTPISLAEEYRIVFEPERGEVVLTGGCDSLGEWDFDDYDGSLVKSHRLRIPTLDGEIPEGDVTIKVEKL